MRSADALLHGRHEEYGRIAANPDQVKWWRSTPFFLSRLMELERDVIRFVARARHAPDGSTRQIKWAEIGARLSKTHGKLFSAEEQYWLGVIQYYTPAATE